MAKEPEAKFEQGAYKEAVDYFKQKVNMPTETYKDLSGAMHSRAFAVAGAMRDDILCDFRRAVDKAIASGTTLQEFRKSYNSIANKWSAVDEGFAAKRERKGYDAWRSKVIYSTNMAVAYAAGREAQMHDPEMKGIWVYARYRCMMDGRERQEHRDWNDVVLEMNDPWWSSHTPPNGWNCRCWKEPVSETEIKEEGLRIRKEPPTDPKDTKGIDEGWHHNAGGADKGEDGYVRFVEEIYDSKERGDGWDVVKTKGLLDRTTEKPDLKTINDERLHSSKEDLKSGSEFKAALDAAIGDNFLQFEKTLKNSTYTYAVNTNDLVGHTYDNAKKGNDKARSRYASMIAETIKEPQEIRAEFLRSNRTGKVAIRHYFYSKFMDANGEEKYIKVVFDANKAKAVELGTPADFISHTTFPNDKNFPAEGTLIYKKK